MSKVWYQIQINNLEREIKNNNKDKDAYKDIKTKLNDIKNDLVNATKDLNTANNNLDSCFKLPQGKADNGKILKTINNTEKLKNNLQSIIEKCNININNITEKNKRLRATIRDYEYKRDSILE